MSCPDSGRVPAGAARERDDTGWSVAELVRRRALARPGELALVDTGDVPPRTWTWRELSAHADRVGASLLGLGLRPGEPVAIQLPNRGEAVIAALAVLRVGAVCCPLPPGLGPRETRMALRRAGISTLVLSEEARCRLYADGDGRMDPGGGAGAGRPPVVLGRAGDAGPCPDAAAEPRWHPFDERPAGDPATPALPDPGLAGPDPWGQLAFTSGTSGEAKCVLHRVRTLTRAARLAADRLGVTEADRVFVPAPLGHHSGFLYGTWLAWVAGCAQVVQGRWDARRALVTLREWGATFTQVAPALLVDLVRAVDGGDAAPAGLRVCVVTGGAVPARLAEHASHRLRAAVCRAWGSTETCMGTLSGPADPPHARWTTDGRALEGVRLRLTDDRGGVLPAGEPGNLEVDGPCLFEGYGLGPAFDRAAFTPDGWYRTGDLAVIDPSGLLRVIGRTTDVVNRGGEKVPVVAIEDVLSGHEAVADVAITGLSDARLGERACAFVVLEPGHDLDLAAVQRYLDGQGVTKHYWPERMEVVERLPRNGGGKVQKFVLRQSVEGVRDPDELRSPPGRR